MAARVAGEELLNPGVIKEVLDVGTALEVPNTAVLDEVASVLANVSPAELIKR